MKLWSIALCLFIFGFGVDAVNSLGPWGATLPDTSVTPVTEAEVRDISEQVSTTGLNPLFTFFVLQTFLKAMVSGMLAILSILPIFTSILGAFGIPLTVSIPIGMLIQGPIWFVMLNGLYQMWTGFNEQGME
jgi:hypothetical protein